MYLPLRNILLSVISLIPKVVEQYKESNIALEKISFANESYKTVLKVDFALFSWYIKRFIIALMLQTETFQPMCSVVLIVPIVYYIFL